MMSIWNDVPAKTGKIFQLEREKYQCITPDILTNEVILTEERIYHIKQRHPGVYEQFFMVLPEMIEDPDYIIKDIRPNTAIVLKEIEDRYFQLALRLITPADNPNYYNSIITFMKIRKKEWERLLRNKTLLYKKE